MKATFHPHRRRRGSVLVIALVLAAAIAIALGSYLQVAKTSLDISHRAYYANAATNLAETGLEQAMWSLNAKDWTGGWAPVTGGVMRTFTSADGIGSYTGNTTGAVVVRVDNHNPAPGSTPTVYAKSLITPYRGAPIEKWLRINCGLGSSPWVGIVAQTMGVSGGAAIFDSYRSKIGGAKVKYMNAIPSGTGINRGANISLVALSTDADSVDGSNSKIYGYISVGAEEKVDAVAFHKNAMLTGDFDADPRTKDLSRITYDASLSIPRVKQPTGGTAIPNITSATTLTSGQYTVNKVDLSGAGSNLTIAPGAKVELYIPTTSTTETVLKVGGNAKIIIPDDAELVIYTPGDVSVTGNNVVNTGSATSFGIPRQFVIYGTRSKTIADRQEIVLGGQGEMYAIVHAPDANITLNGGGSSGHFYGALVGHHAELNGGANVTWDETLADDTTMRVWRVAEWIEYTTATERATIADKFEADD